jgi:hypothetical protein
MQYTKLKDGASEPVINKSVSPKQLELVTSKCREDLAGAPHLYQESPAFKADPAKVDKIAADDTARGPIMGSGFAFGYRADISDDDFNWDSAEEDSVILREQRATAAYRNKAGELIIRQRAAWDEDRDTFVFISPENEVAFLEGVAKRARE